MALEKDSVSQHEEFKRGDAHEVAEHGHAATDM